MTLTVFDTTKITDLFLNKKLGVLSTDTIYGLHCISGEASLIDMLYQVKQRPDKMPFITLIPNEVSLESYGVVLTNFLREQIKLFWPGPNTLIFKLVDGSTMSFRLPKNDFLQTIFVADRSAYFYKRKYPWTAFGNLSARSRKVFW